VSVVANVAINVDSRNAVSKLRQVNDAGSKLEQTFKGVDGKLRDSSGRFIKLGDSAQASTGKINVLARALSNLGTGLAVADVARRYFKGFNEAEKAAAAVRTLGVDSKALEGNLLGLSQKLGGLFSQTQLLTAAYDVASSGFANAADNTKVLEAAAKGATGGLSDINTVGNAVTSVLNAYGKSADEAASLVDGFIQTQNDGKIILNEYAGYIGKLAPTAKAAGVGINEMNAAIATITAQGVPVEATFTGLNQALVSILKPSQEAEELAKSLGIQFNEAGLRAKGFGGLLEEVKTKTGGSTTQLVKLFGSVDALKAVLPLVNDDLVKYNQNVVKQANASGVAEKATEELGGTVSSEITKMINQIGNLVRSLDTVLGPALGGIVRLINFVIAEATKGIQVLGQLFSMSPGKKIAFEAVQSGNLGAAARVLPGIDETIGEKRRKDLQRQAGAGTGFMGMGMDQSKFIKLLQQQPEFKVPATAGNKPAEVVDPALQALLDKLAAGGGGGTGTGKGAGKGTDDAARIAEQIRASKLRLTLAQDIFAIEGRLQQAQLEGNEQLALARNAQKELAQIASQRADIIANKEMPALEKKNVLDKLAIDAATVSGKLGFDLAKIEQDRIKSFDEIIAGVTNQIAVEEQLTEKSRAEVLLKQEIAKLQKDGVLITDEQVNAYKKVNAALDETKAKVAAIKQQQEMLDGLYAGIGNTIANGVGGAIDALSSGVDNLGETLQSLAADILKAVGKMLIFYALAQAFGALGGDDGVGVFSFLAKAFGGGRASGGPVAPNTNYIVGENGPELLSMGGSGGKVYSNNDSKMQSAMSRYSRGARGESVLAGGGASSESGAPAAGGPMAIDVRYSVERINDVEYVTASQFQAGLRQAAQQGAAQGEQRTLRRLQQSPSTRKRVGV
jgi:TP901 family phage tail tape measure protein